MIKHLYDEIAKRWLGGCDSIWVISDPHFGDLESYKLRHTTDTMLIDGKKHYQTAGNIWEDEDSLKCSMDCFDEWLIKQINSKAGKTSCLIILGDVGDLECVKRLKAKRKILIMGNHDKGASNYKRIVKSYYKKEILDKKPGDFECDLTDATFRAFMESFYKERTDTYEIKDNHLFDEVYEGPVMINDRVILSHEPIMGYGNYLFNIHGHVHNKKYQGDLYHLNCCAEAIDYTPINLLSILKNGLLKNIDSIHRVTIEMATNRKERK